MNFMTFHSVGNVIIPTDLHIFRGVGQPPTIDISSQIRDSNTKTWVFLPNMVETKATIPGIAFPTKTTKTTTWCNPKNFGWTNFSYDFETGN
jgi:hypothetical protein